MTTRKPIALSVKLGATMISVIVIALLMATALNFLRFEETFKRLIAQRLDISAQEIARVVVTGLDLGLGIEAQAHLPEVVHNYQSTHPDITRISVFDCTGRTVIGTNDNGDDAWENHLGKATWNVFGADRVGVGTTVKNNLGKCAAGIVVETSSERYVAAMAAVTKRFILITVLVTVAACMAAIGAVVIFNRNTLHRLDDDLKHLATDDGSEPSTSLSADDFTDPWERMLAESYLDARPILAARAKDERGGDAS